jgi:hypothetical protein
MAVLRYGSKDPIPEGYTRVRDILGGMGFTNDQIGYNQQTDNPILKGVELDRTKLVKGADNYYYATPDIMKTMLSGLGLLPAAGYQSPYAQQIGDILGNIQNRPAYQSPYAGQIQDLIGQLSSMKPFQYDPNKDPGFQQASKQIQNKIMLDFARRNMLYSPATGEAVGEGVAMAMPQFEQMAYQRYMDSQNNLLNQLGVFSNLDTKAYNMYQDQGEDMYSMLSALSSLDSRTYQMYKDAIDNEYKEWEKTRTERIDKITERRNEIDDAWRRVEELGYVDDYSGAILGILPGTKSKAARERVEKLEDELKIMEREEKYKIAAEARALKNQKAIIDYKDELDKKNQQAAQGTAAQQSNYQMLADVYFTSDLYRDDPKKALTNLITNQGQYRAALGPMYDVLYTQLSDLIKLAPEQAKGEERKPAISAADIKSRLGDIEKDIKLELQDERNQKKRDTINEKRKKAMIDVIFQNAQILGNEGIEEMLRYYNLPTGEEAYKIYVKVE